MDYIYWIGPAESGMFRQAPEKFVFRAGIAFHY